MCMCEQCSHNARTYRYTPQLQESAVLENYDNKVLLCRNKIMGEVCRFPLMNSDQDIRKLQQLTAVILSMKTQNGSVKGQKLLPQTPIFLMPKAKPTESWYVWGNYCHRELQISSSLMKKATRQIQSYCLTFCQTDSCCPVLNCDEKILFSSLKRNLSKRHLPHDQSYQSHDSLIKAIKEVFQCLTLLPHAPNHQAKAD